MEKGFIATYNLDCLDAMERLVRGPVDLILTDPPYGTTQNKWDVAFDLDKFWRLVKEILAPNGVVAMCASQPFTSRLVLSNMKWFKYDLVWEKSKSTGHLNVNKAPLRKHESILVFSPGKGVYNPQKTIGHAPASKFTPKATKASTYSEIGAVRNLTGGQTDRYPTSILKINGVNGFSKKEPPLHPTQKPVALMEYLIKTYSNEGAIILDPFMGSGTTGVGALNLYRSFIGIEKDRDYYKIAAERLEKVNYS